MSKVVFITGASSGLGASLAKLYAKKGYAVALAARRKDRIDALTKELLAARGKTIAIQCDVTDKNQVHQAVALCEATLGPIDIMIANAGVAHKTNASNFDAAALVKTYETNVFGVAYCFEAVLPSMLERGRGQLVGISSMAGFRGVPGAVAYCSSKAALNNLMESLRVELLKTGVQVTTICPGFVKTEMTSKNTSPMPFLLASDDAGKRIFRAIDQAKTEFSFPWPISALMKLARHLPNFAYDRAVTLFRA